MFGRNCWVNLTRGNSRQQQREAVANASLQLPVPPATAHRPPAKTAHRSCLSAPPKTTDSGEGVQPTDSICCGAALLMLLAPAAAAVGVCSANRGVFGARMSHTVTVPSRHAAARWCADVGDHATSDTQAEDAAAPAGTVDAALAPAAAPALPSAQYRGTAHVARSPSASLMVVTTAAPRLFADRVSHTRTQRSEWPVASTDASGAAAMQWADLGARNTASGASVEAPLLLLEEEEALAAAAAASTSHSRSEASSEALASWLSLVLTHATPVTPEEWMPVDEAMGDSDTGLRGPDAEDDEEEAPASLLPAVRARLLVRLAAAASYPPLSSSSPPS